jgi:hypothetical protein
VHLEVTLALKKHSFGLKIRLQNAFTASRALLPSASCHTQPSKFKSKKKCAKWLFYPTAWALGSITQGRVTPYEDISRRLFLMEMKGLRISVNIFAAAYAETGKGGLMLFACSL